MADVTEQDMQDIGDSIVEPIRRYEEERTEQGRIVLQRRVSTMGFSERIDGIVDEETAKEAIEDKDFIESALKRAHQYAEYAKDFCIAECQMYVKIASVVKTLGKKGTDELIVQWIRSKTDDEVSRIAEECSRGIRIQEVRRNEMSVQRAMKRERAYESCVNKMLVDYVQNGRTEISHERFYREYEGGGRIDNRKASAWLDRARIEVRKRGAIAIGDGSGTYVNPTPSMIEQIEEIRDAVIQRLEGIANDVTSVSNICESTGVRPSAELISKIRKRLNALEEACSQ